MSSRCIKINEDNIIMKTLHKPVIILCGGGHARVLIDTLIQRNCKILGIVDNEISKHGSNLEGITVIGDDSKLSCYPVDKIILVNGLGSAKGTGERKLLFEKYKQKGFIFARVIHPAVVISPGVVLGEGVQVMAGAVIQTGCIIGDNAIINTKVSVDHDCRIGANVHLAPGVTISGGVVIENNVHIGCGATVIQGVKIGEGSIIGAGAVVLEDVQPWVTAVGLPARVVKS